MMNRDNMSQGMRYASQPHREEIFSPSRTVRETSRHPPRPDHALNSPSSKARQNIVGDQSSWGNSRFEEWKGEGSQLEDGNFTLEYDCPNLQANISNYSWEDDDQHLLARLAGEKLSSHVRPNVGGQMEEVQPIFCPRDKDLFGNSDQGLKSEGMQCFAPTNLRQDHPFPDQRTLFDDETQEARLRAMILDRHSIPTRDRLPSDSRISSIAELDARRKEEEFARPLYFNAIVVGASGLGKSTFIDAFINKRFQRKEVIRPPTSQIHEITGHRKEGKQEFLIKFIDTPGFNEDRDLRQCYKEIKGYLMTRLEEYEYEGDTADKTFQFRYLPQLFADPRVHVCLYFLSGPRILGSDLWMMKKLQKFVPIIPILAKGDTYTVQEIKEIKATLLKDALSNDIEWFNCGAAVKNNREKLLELSDGKFGHSPPFVMVSSIEKIEVSPDHFVYGRKYSWGICDIDNPEHSDFRLLYYLLIGYFSVELVKLSDSYYADYQKMMRKKDKKRRKREDESKKLLASAVTAVAFCVFGAGVFLKNKLKLSFGS
eukprot:TRINITY_DN11852_c0_g1_i3.p1 TRINITY_DN11852_c0_g1~~TRINITY_DN11852_c0_g1_i3.p1  ORF type:complete len:541 (+),score=82.85 TRINITY_DN11852_c0_g1_i3:34-1656(+)